jgi:glutamyl-tRNA reductase
MRKPDAPEEARREELLRALRLLKNGDEPGRVLETLSQRLTNRLLHPPTKALA